MVSSICTTPLFRSESFLRQKYEVERLSARQIAILISTSHSVINHALDHFNIERIPQQSGWKEYGFKLINGKKIPHVREQNIIQRMVRWRNAKWSFNRIASKLNSLGIKTQSGGGQWYGPTVKRILKSRLK